MNHQGYNGHTAIGQSDGEKGGLGPCVRRATAADTVQIAALVHRASEGMVEVHASFDCSLEPCVDDWFDSARVTESKIQDEIRRLQKQGYFLVLDCKSGGLAAAIHVEMTCRRGYFDWLCVAPEYRGHGLSRRLIAIAEALCEAEGCTAMEMPAAHSRAEHSPWYHSLGYRERHVAAAGSPPFEPIHIAGRSIRVTKALA